MFTTWGHKPDDTLVLLEDSGWPDDVRQHIVQCYAKYGQDISGIKLVEPTANRFHGPASKETDWQLAKDYFEWEAASLHDEKQANALQQRSMEKRGYMFNHYQVYLAPGEW